MFFLDIACEKCFKFLDPSIASTVLAFHQLYTTVPLHILLPEEQCFPPNFYNSLFYLTFVVAGVSFLSGLSLLAAIYLKKDLIFVMAFLLVQNISIAYVLVSTLLLYINNYDDEKDCYPDILLLGVHLLLLAWQFYVYICVNSYRVQRVKEERMQDEEAGEENGENEGQEAEY